LFSNEFPTGSDLIKNKLSTMKSKLNKQTNVMAVFSKETDITTEASFCMAFDIARAKRPYTDGIYLTKNILDVISILKPEDKKLLNMVENISNSRHTMERRISMISSDIFSNLQNEIAHCSALS
jgi:hypothetical protein